MPQGCCLYPLLVTRSKRSCPCIERVLGTVTARPAVPWLDRSIPIGMATFVFK